MKRGNFGRKSTYILAAVTALCTPVELFAANLYYIGPDGGVWNNPANWSTTPGGSSANTTPGAGTNVTLATSSGNVTVTFDGNYPSTGIGSLTLDGTSTATLSLQQSANILTTSSPVSIGLYGDAVDTLGGGTLSVGDSIYVGLNAGSSGTLQLTGGQVLMKAVQQDSTAQWVGVSGQGTVIQTAGLNTQSRNLQLGVSASGSGTYQLEGGTLTATSELLGEAGAGLLKQDGGVNLASFLFVGPTTQNGSGSYQLNGGTLTSGVNGGSTETLANRSSVLQTGGTNDAFELVINPGGTYTLSSGVLNLTYFQNIGTMDFGQAGGGTLTAGFISPLDFTSGAFLNLSQATILGDSAVIILPAGSDPATMFKSFSNTGITHVTGTPLDLGGRGLALVDGFRFHDQLILSGFGNVSATVFNGSAYLDNGLQMSESSTMQLGPNGGLTVNDTTSGVSGTATFKAKTAAIGTTGTALFTQSGGSVSLSSLTIGSAGANGTYLLSGGSLGVTAQTVSASGAFRMLGGILNAAAFSNQGITILEAGTLSGFTNTSTGIVDLQTAPADAISFTGDITNQGLFKKTVGGNNVTVPSISNTGTVEADAGSLTFGSVSQLSGSTLTFGTWKVMDTAALSLGGNITRNGGVIVLDGAAPTFNGLSALASNTGSLTLLHGATQSITGPLANSGRLTLGESSSLLAPGGFSQTSTGELHGKGSISGNASLGGILSPDGGAGALTFLGNLTLTSNAALDFQLGDPNSSLDDRIDVMTGTAGPGNLVLDGTINISAAQGFGAGAFTILTYQGNLTDNGLQVGTMPTGFEGFIEAGGGVVRLNVTAVPEPGSLLLASPLLMLFRRRSRRKCSK